MFEILVTRKSEPAPRPITFQELYAIRHDLHSIMLLWDINCYYVTIDNSAFIVNGGRRISFATDIGEHPQILYRRRNSLEVSFSDGVPRDGGVQWIIGIESEDTGNRVFLKVSEDGASWEWGTKL